MPDFRALGQPASPDSHSITLSRDESHHLVVVNRAQNGHPVVVFDGHGHEWLCRVQTASKTAALLDIVERMNRAPLPFHVALGQGLPKGAAMDGIVRKATEIGAATIWPVLTERTQVHLEGAREDKKTDKWQVAAVEAAKQCGNPWVPKIESPVAFDDFLREASAYDLKLVASLHPGAEPLGTVFARWRKTHARLPDRAIWLIGPEGDLSPREVETAVTAGFLPVTLGPLVLRCETAATYALAVLTHEWTQAQ